MQFSGSAPAFFRASRAGNGDFTPYKVAFSGSQGGKSRDSLDASAQAEVPIFTRHRALLRAADTLGADLVGGPDPEERSIDPVARMSGQIAGLSPRHADVERHRETSRAHRDA